MIETIKLYNMMNSCIGAHTTDDESFTWNKEHLYVCHAFLRQWFTGGFVPDVVSLSVSKTRPHLKGWKMVSIKHHGFSAEFCVSGKYVKDTSMITCQADALNKRGLMDKTFWVKVA